MFLIKNAIIFWIVNCLSVLCLANTIINSDKVEINKASLSCIQNKTCAKNLANDFVGALNNKKEIDFGGFSIEPTSDKEASVEGRSSKFVNLFNRNLVRIPVGLFDLTIQKSSDYDNYFEFAVARKVEGRASDRKQMRIFVPAFLVMSQVGWWILAIAFVKLLSIKAFFVSKFALIVAAVMTLKKLFEHVHTIPPHYYEHPEPVVMPYNFDFNNFNSPIHHDFQASEFHPSLPLNGGHEQTAALHHSGALGSETNQNNVIHNITGSGSPQSSGLGNYATVGNNIKRHDFYPAKHPLSFNFLGKSPYLLRKP